LAVLLKYLCGGVFMSVFSERLRQLRKENGLPQKNLGELLGISLSTIFRWENDERVPNATELGTIAVVLNTSIAYLIGETDDPTSPKDGVNRGELESNIVIPHPANMILIKIISKEYRVCCGTGIDWGSEAIEFESSVLIDAPDLARRHSDGDLIGVYADGDSMEPNVYDNDLVFFAWREKSIPYAGAPMVVSYNNKMLIRGLIENNRKMVTMKAHNKDYNDIVVTPDDDFDICGRVVKVFASREPRSVL
jgi:transcriptional regulator with XRE-family HTH domain